MNTKYLYSLLFIFEFSLLITGIQALTTARITLYQAPFQEGDGTTVVISENCGNLPASLQQSSNSIDTNGYCVVLYSQSNCQGKYWKFLQYEERSNRMDYIGFANTAVSVQLCSSLQPQKVYLFKQAQYEGSKLTLSVPGDGSCANIDSAFRILEPKGIGSIAPLREASCFLAYLENDCHPPALRIYRGSDEAADLKKINWHQSIRSMSVCKDKPRCKI